VPIISSVIGDEFVNNAQNENLDSNKVKSSFLDMTKIKNDKDDKFEFKEQLKLIQDMGFMNIETIKFLLIKNKGGVDRVIEELLK